MAPSPDQRSQRVKINRIALGVLGVGIALVVVFVIISAVSGGKSTPSADASNSSNSPGAGASNSPGAGASNSPSGTVAGCPAFVDADHQCSEYDSVAWTKSPYAALKPQLMKALDLKSRKQQSNTSEFCRTWNRTLAYYKSRSETSGTDSDSDDAVVGMAAFVVGAYDC